MASLLRFLSISQRSTHFAIFILDLSFPTFTVAIIFTQSHDIAKHVSSKNELCSEYGTPYICTANVDFCMGFRSECVKDRDCPRDMMDGMGGLRSLPGGGVYLQWTLLINRRVHREWQMLTSILWV